MATNADHHEILSSPSAGHRAIRGGALRASGYAVGVLLSAAASVLLLRHLGVVVFGQFVTVMAIISIVTSLSEAGMQTIGQRDYVLRETSAQRRSLIANMLGIRLMITPLGVLIAVAFTIVANFSSAEIIGTAIAGLGLIVFMYQATLTIPLASQLKFGWITASEVTRQLVIVAFYIVLVLMGSGLALFLGVQIPAALAALTVIAILVRKHTPFKPMFKAAEWRRLIKDSLPMAAAVAVNVLYFRILIVMMSLIATGVQTGLFGTSYKVIELLLGIPTTMLPAALPILAYAGRKDEQRLKNALQRMTEVGLVIAAILILVIVTIATPLIELLGGAQYKGAGPVLQIQVFAMIGIFLGQAWQLGLVAIHRQSAVIVGNILALFTVVLLGLILIPSNGATGAAIAAVIGESVLAVTMLAMIVKLKREIAPRLGFSIKVLVAAAVAAIPLLIPGMNAYIAALVVLIAYIIMVIVLRVIPKDVIQAFLKRDGLAN